MEKETKKEGGGGGMGREREEREEREWGKKRRPGRDSALYVKECYKNLFRSTTLCYTCRYIVSTVIQGIYRVSARTHTHYLAKKKKLYIH